MSYQQKSLSLPAHFNYWRWRVLFTCMFAYASYYLVRGNMTMAVPGLIEHYHFSKSDLGFIFGIGSIVYGVGKFLNGYLSDRTSAQTFMTLGLIGTALCSFFLSFQNSLLQLGLFWVVSQWFQSMGWPPCSRLMTHWFSKREIGFVWGIWNSSHQLGTIAISTLGPLIVLHFGLNALFSLPALFCLAMSLIIFFNLRDTPESMGFPSIEEIAGEGGPSNAETEPFLSFKEIFWQKIFPNANLWRVCIANFFVYIVRIGFFSWIPTFAHEYRQVELSTAGWQFALFELAGLLGGIFAGRLSDGFFKGNRTLLCGINLMIICLVLCLFYLPDEYKIFDSLAFFLIGFLIYGPQSLVGVAATDFASKKAAGTASGLTGLFGYLGSSVAGVAVGYLAEHYTWIHVLGLFQLSCVLGAIIFFISYRKETQTP